MIYSFASTSSSYKHTQPTKGNFSLQSLKGHEDINHLFVYVRLHGCYATKYLAVICRTTTTRKLSYRLSSPNTHKHFSYIFCVPLNIPIIRMWILMPTTKKSKLLMNDKHAISQIFFGTKGVLEYDLYDR